MSGSLSQGVDKSQIRREKSSSFPEGLRQGGWGSDVLRPKALIKSKRVNLQRVIVPSHEMKLSHLRHCKPIGIHCTFLRLYIIFMKYCLLIRSIKREWGKNYKMFAIPTQEKNNVLTLKFR